MGVREKSVAVLALAVLGLTACGGDNGSQAATADFKKEASGSLTAWAFDNADDVGKARMQYAARSCRRQDHDGSDGFRRAEIHHTRCQWRRAGRGADGPGSSSPPTPPRASSNPSTGALARTAWIPKKQFYPGRDPAGHLSGQDLGGAPVLPAGCDHPEPGVLEAEAYRPSDIDTSDKPEAAGRGREDLQVQRRQADSTLGFDPVAGGQAELWLLGQGGKLTDDTGKPALDDPDNIKAIDPVQADLRRPGRIRQGQEFHRLVRHLRQGQPVRQGPGGRAGRCPVVRQRPRVLCTSTEDHRRPVQGQGRQALHRRRRNIVRHPRGSQERRRGMRLDDIAGHRRGLVGGGQARAEKIASTPGAINTGLFTGSPSADKAIRDKFVKASGNAGFDQTIATYYDVVAGRQDRWEPRPPARPSRPNSTTPSPRPCSARRLRTKPSPTPRPRPNVPPTRLAPEGW